MLTSTPPRITSSSRRRTSGMSSASLGERNRPQALYQTAEDLLERIVTVLGVPLRPRGKPIGPGIWIQWTLRRVPTDTWTMWKEYVKLMDELGYGFAPTTYHNFHKNIWYLTKLQLI